MDVDAPSSQPASPVVAEAGSSAVSYSTPSVFARLTLYRQSGPSKKEKKKKHKSDATAAEPASETPSTAVEPVTPAKKEKKRKRKETDDAMDVDTPAKPTKKSKPGEIPDPSSDEGLSASGREGEYI